MRCRKEEDLRKIAEKAGWKFSKTNSGHWKGVSPTGEIVVFASTPGDKRSYLNTRSRMRRAGLDV